MKTIKKKKMIMTMEWKWRLVSPCALDLLACLPTHPPSRMQKEPATAVKVTNAFGDTDDDLKRKYRLAPDTETFAKAALELVRPFAAKGAATLVPCLHRALRSVSVLSPFSRSRPLIRGKKRASSRWGSCCRSSLAHSLARL
jgi:hypothetical protein